jgi:anti-anti-sigma factor
MHTEIDEGNFKVYLSGELDLLSAAMFKDVVSEGLQKAPTGVLVDLSKLEFMDSSGLGTLVKLHRQAQEEGWLLQIKPSDSERVQKIFEVTKTQDYFTWI